MKKPLVFASVVTASVAFVAACKGGNEESSATSPASSSSKGAGRAPYLPARSVNDNSPGPLSEVEAVLFTLRPKLNDCYRTASATRPSLSADAVFQVGIGSDGRVTSVSLLSETGLDPALTACTTEALKGARFKSPGDAGSAVINVPINFRPPPGKSG